MEVIESTKGKPCATYNGFIYRRMRESRDGKVTWVCLKEKTQCCRGKLLTRDGEVTGVTAHHCDADVAGLEVRKALCRAKKRAREDVGTPITKIFKEELEVLQNKDNEIATRLPQLSSVKSSLYANRKQAWRSKIKPNNLKVVISSDEEITKEELEPNTDDELPTRLPQRLKVKIPLHTNRKQNQECKVKLKNPMEVSSSGKKMLKEELEVTQHNFPTKPEIKPESLEEVASLEEQTNL